MSGLIQEQQQLGKDVVNVGKNVANATIDAMGRVQYNQATPVGKGMLITWWVLIVAVLIYMIVLAIIYYNDYTKWQYNEKTKKWEWNTGKKGTDGKDIIEVYTGLTEDEIVTWNIHKTVMNGLLAFMNIFGVILFVFAGTGDVEKTGKDVCGSRQLGWVCTLNIIWFIVNMVWDIKNSQFTKAEQTTNSGPEKFCGMMETFCGSVSEGFSNVAKKLRKF